MTTTRRLFIEETTPGATHGGIREVWEPSLEEMAELGWQRTPSTIPPAKVQPCPVHTNSASTLCGQCNAFLNRDEVAT